MRDSYLLDVAKNFRNLTHQVSALEGLEANINRAFPDIFGRVARIYSPNSEYKARKGYLLDLVRYYKGTPDQDAAYLKLQKEVNSLIPAALTSFAAAFSAPQKSSTIGEAGEIKLPVRYFYQQDSATGHDQRMCQSSSCAMLLEYMKPNTLPGVNGDDKYLARVHQYGDTTDGNAHTPALRSFGLETKFVTNFNWNSLVKQLRGGFPVPCGVLHHGPSTAPTGGGHWICVVGLSADEGTVILHDPYGELDWANGSWLNVGFTAGQFLRVSKQSFCRRWLPDGSATGYAHILA